MIQPSAESNLNAGEALLIDATGLARLLGLSLRTVRRLDCSGKLPRPVRIGGAVRWRVEEVTAWLESDCPDREQWQTLRKSRGKAN
jgi:prophage regulatory protein